MKTGYLVSADHSNPNIITRNLQGATKSINPDGDTYMTFPNDCDGYGNVRPAQIASKDGSKYCCVIVCKSKEEAIKVWEKVRDENIADLKAQISKLKKSKPVF